VRPNTQKKRSIIVISTMLALAILGLVFIRTDNASADKNFKALSQNSLQSENGSTAEFADTPSVMPSLFRIISALILVIGSIYGGLYLLKKMMGRKYAGVKNNANLEVMESIHIAPKKTVTLLRVGEKSVLVGSTEGSMSLLSELDHAETAKLLQKIEVEPAQDNFGIFLRQAVDKVKEVARRKTSTVLEQNH